MRRAWWNCACVQLCFWWGWWWCHCAWPELFYYPLLPFSLHGPLLLHHHCTLIPLSMQCIASQAFLLQQHLHFTAVPCICVLLHSTELTSLHFTELTLVALSAMGALYMLQRNTNFHAECLSCSKLLQDMAHVVYSASLVSGRCEKGTLYQARK